MELKDYFMFIHQLLILSQDYAILERDVFTNQDKFFYDILSENFPESLTYNGEQCKITFSDNLLGNVMYIELPEPISPIADHLNSGKIDKITFYRTQTGRKTLSTICFRSVNKNIGTLSYPLDLSRCATILGRVFSVGMIKVNDVIETLPEPYAGILSGLYMRLKLKGGSKYV